MPLCLGEDTVDILCNIITIQVICNIITEISVIKVNKRKHEKNFPHKHITRIKMRMPVQFSNRVQILSVGIVPWGLGYGILSPPRVSSSSQQPLYAQIIFSPCAIQICSSVSHSSSSDRSPTERVSLSCFSSVCSQVVTHTHSKCWQSNSAFFFPKLPACALLVSLPFSVRLFSGPLCSAPVAFSLTQHGGRLP